MKKKVFLLVVTLLMAIMGIQAYGNEADINVEVDGKLLEFDVSPQIVQGRTLVPFRGIFEALGSDVDWEPSSKTAIGLRGNVRIKLPIGKTRAFVNERQVELDVPATIINGRTFVPVRFIAESLGAMVDWNGETQTVIIKEMGKKEYVENYFASIEGAEGLYTGETQNGSPNGLGTMEFFETNIMRAKKYKGEFRNGKLVGEGVFEWQNGDKYIGVFLNSNKHGEGTKIWVNGDTYKGKWEEDVRSGQGTMTWANKDQYVGQWKDDVRSGQGTMTWVNGDQYVGEWKNDVRSGQGTMTWANGDKYVGAWKEDKASGEGTITWANGDKYVGKWENGQRHGRGVWTSASGEVLSGIWENNELVDDDNKWKVN